VRSALQLAPLVVAAAALLAFGGKRDALRPAIDDSSSEDPPGADPGGSSDADEAKASLDDADEEDEDSASDDTDTEEAPLLEAPDGGKRRPRGGCPSTMVRAGNFCIDRYEAPNRRGGRPLVMQSANDANDWCQDHNKRLCTEDEWIAACQGEERRTYPYGNEHVDGRCNDDKEWQKVDEALLAKWPSPEAKAHAKELYQATPSGSKRKCTSEAGARDMTGNVEEWVVRTREHANAFPYILIGCYWSGCYGGNKPTCHSTNNAHGPSFRFYETGFRCCRDAAGTKK
jgi:formylglycine-generating enzyme required for sulfatase activity